MNNSTLHMSSEEVSALLSQIESLLRQWDGDLSLLRNIGGALHQLWEAPAASEYIYEVHRILRQMEREVERLQHNHRLAWKEFEQWLLADARLGDGRAFSLSALARIALTAARFLVPGMGAAFLFSKALGMVADPVDVTSGVYVAKKEDLTFLVPGFPYPVARTYIGRLPDPGWAFSFQIRLFNLPEEARILWGPAGLLGIYRFWRSERDEFIADKAGTALSYEGGTQRFAFRAEDGNTYFFDSEGHLVSITSAEGVEILLEGAEEHGLLIKDARKKVWGRIQQDEEGNVVRIEDEAGRAIVYDYDAQGRLIAVTNRAGQVTRYQYTRQGLLAAVIGPEGKKLLENRYDAQGRVISQRDAAGYEMQFTYEASSETGEIREVSVTYPNGAQVRYVLEDGEVVRQQLDDTTLEYRRDERGYIVEIQDPNGKVKRLGWDAEGRLTSVTDPAGHTYRFTYNEWGAILSSEDPAGARMEVAYDQYGRPVRLLMPDGAEIGFEYDEYGLLTAWTDPLGRRTTVAHDESGRIASIVLPDGATYKYEYPSADKVVEIDPLGRSSTFEYDAEDRPQAFRRNGHGLQVEYTPEGLPAALQDMQGRRVQASYDERGLPVSLRFPNGYELRQTFDALGHPVVVEDAQGQTLFKHTYDEQGRMVALTDAKGQSWRYTYDKAGNLISVTDRKGRTLRFKYDDAYRLTHVYDPNGRLQVEMEYDAAGRVRRMVDAEGHSLAFTFDALGRLLATAWDDKEARAVLDAAGQLERLFDEKGRERIYAYDERGNLVKEVYPLEHTYSYDYDAAGRLRQHTLPDGTQIAVSYDAIDRPISLHYKRGEEEFGIDQNYSDDDRELSLRDEVGEIHYALDEEKGVLERTGVFGHTVRYEFAADGHVNRLVYPGDLAVTYEYDANGNLTTIRDFAQHETYIEYDASDLPVKVQHPNGFVTLYEYDEMDRVVLIRHLNAAGELLVEQRWQRDATGHVAKTEIAGPITERLARIPDARSKRHFEFNELDQITTSDEGAFRYDKRGNMVEYVDEGEAVNLRYGLRDFLEEAQIGSEKFQYTYDAEGNRVAVHHNGHTARYVLDAVLDLPRPLVEMDEAGQVQRYYIWGTGLQYALDADGHVEVYLFNHRGDTLAVVDGEGEVVAAYDYADYGQVVGRYGEDVPFRFLGRWGIMADHDGLYYIRARYYAPRIGVFTQPDWMRVRAPLPRFLNRYAYALDDPWNIVDVDGRCPCLAVAGFIAASALVSAGSEVFTQLVLDHKSHVDWRYVETAAISGVVGGGSSLLFGPVAAGAVGAFVDRTLNNIFIDHKTAWSGDNAWWNGVPTAVVQGAMFAWIGGKLMEKVEGAVAGRIPFRPLRDLLLSKKYGAEGIKALEAVEKALVRSGKGPAGVFMGSLLTGVLVKTPDKALDKLLETIPHLKSPALEDKSV